MKRWIWRLSAAWRLHDQDRWRWSDAWSYSAALHTYTDEDAGITPQGAIEEDRQYWE